MRLPLKADTLVLDSLMVLNNTFFSIYRFSGQEFFDSGLSDAELIAKGDRYYVSGHSDSALHCFRSVTLRYSRIEKQRDPDPEQKVFCMQALNRMGVIYLNFHSNIQAFQHFLAAVDLNQEVGDNRYRLNILNNVAILYAQYDDLEKAYSVFSQVFDDAYRLGLYRQASYILNNILFTAMQENSVSKVERWVGKACDTLLSDYPQTRFSYGMGSAYLQMARGVYAAAYPYLEKAFASIPYLEDSMNAYASFYHRLALAYQGQGRYREAVDALEKSSGYASARKNRDQIRDNCRVLAETYRREGNTRDYVRAVDRYIAMVDSTYDDHQYFQLKDLEFSVLNSRQEKRIEGLEQEKAENAHTIRTQKRIILFSAAFLLAVSVFLVVFRMQKKRVQEKNRILFAKNLQLMEVEKENSLQRNRMSEALRRQQEKIRFLEGRLAGNGPEEAALEEEYSRQASGRYSRSYLDQEQKLLLADQIRALMEEKDLFLQPDFSLEKLSKELKSNTSYVSQVINEILGKNFTAMVNEYRVRKACRLINDPANRNYTLDYLSGVVGFRSRNSFYTSFKKYTGLTPAQYMRISLQQEETGSE